MVEAVFKLIKVKRRSIAYGTKPSQFQWNDFIFLNRGFPNLKNISCKNKDKLIPNSHPGLYKLNVHASQYMMVEQKENQW